MDLVEISPNAEPPVCRIMDYGKFLYEKSKTTKEQKKKAESRPGQGNQIPSWHRRRRLSGKTTQPGSLSGRRDKAKVTLRFRGREMAHQDLGIKVLERVKNDLEELAVVESFPKVEGRQAVMVLAPKKKS